MPRILFIALVGAGLLAGTPAQACTMSSWSSVSGSQGLTTGTPDEGHRRFQGHCGLKVEAGQQARYVEDTSPSGETSYYLRFYFLADDLDLDAGDWVDLFAAYRNPSRPVPQLAVRVQETAEGRELVLRSLDGGQMSASGPVPIRAGWQAVTLSWQQASGAANGQAELALNGKPRATLSGLDSRDSVIDLARLGMVSSRGGRGELYFDAFESRRKTPVETLLAGDASGDESLGATDLVALVNEINGISLAKGQPDCNADGTVDEADLDCLANAIVNR